MRFTIPVGNSCAVLDRAEGKMFHLPNAFEAASLHELLNMMHEQIIAAGINGTTPPVQPSGEDISERNVPTAVTTKTEETTDAD